MREPIRMAYSCSDTKVRSISTQSARRARKPWESPAVTSAGIPVVYKLDFKDPRGFFAAQRFLMRDNDVLYVSNAASTDIQKLLSVFTGGIGSAAATASLSQTTLRTDERRSRCPCNQNGDVPNIRPGAIPVWPLQEFGRDLRAGSARNRRAAQDPGSRSACPHASRGEDAIWPAERLDISGR